MSTRQDHRRWADHALGKAEATQSGTDVAQTWALIAIAQAILALGGDDEEPADG